MTGSQAVKVLIAQPAGESIAHKIKRAIPSLNVCFYPSNRAEDIPEATWKTCDVLYTERALPAPELVPNLKWIQFHYAGIDYAAKAPILAKPGLHVTTLSGVPALPMGEYALMMLLALGHRLEEMRNYQAYSTWPENRFEVFSPKELRKSTVGIVGYGSTGRQIGRLLKGFGAKVVAVKRDVANWVDTGYAPRGSGDPRGRFVDRYYSLTQLREMLAICDFVVIAVPLSRSTRGMIGRAELSSMKTGAFLIDISRGGVVDHDELIMTLQSGQLGGAALDVFPVEPLPQDDPIWKCKNVWISPHISGYSPCYFEDAGRLFIKNMRLFLTGKPMLNLYQTERGY